MIPLLVRTEILRRNFLKGRTKEPSLDVGASYVVVHGNKDGKTKAHERSSKRKKLHALVMELKARNDHDEERLP
jgi:hypothetical protein